MALSESTGEIILRAAQGLSRTLDVQAQMVQRQIEFEAQQKQVTANLRAKNERDQLSHETALLRLESDKLRFQELKGKQTPEAIARRLAAETLDLKTQVAALALVRARTENLKVDRKRANNAFAQGLMEAGSLRISADTLGPTDELKVLQMKLDRSESIESLPAAEHVERLKRIANTGSASKLAIELRAINQNLIAARGSNAFVIGRKGESLDAAIATVNRLELDKAAVIFLSNKMSSILLNMDDNQRVAMGRNPAEQATIQNFLDQQSSSLNLAERYQLTPTVIQRAFDNPAGNYSEVRRLFTGKITLDDLQGKREFLIQAKDQGLSDAVADKLLEEILTGTQVP